MLEGTRDPGMLVVGSSVAWRHFNGTAAVAMDPALKPYNAGFCGANMTEVEKITNWLTGRLPSVTRVVLIASPFDFENCTKATPSQFNVADADNFVFEGGSPALYYARYFDPIVLAKNAVKVRWARSSVTAMDPLVQDLYGDAPSEPLETRGLFYGKVAIDPPCFDALRRTAFALQRKGIAFDVTITPMHPNWVRQFAPPPYTHAFDTGLQASLAGTKARFVSTTFQPDPHAFYDAMHMRWSTTAPFTRWLINAVNAKEAAPPVRIASLGMAGAAR